MTIARQFHWRERHYLARRAPEGHLKPFLPVVLRSLFQACQYAEMGSRSDPGVGNAPGYS